MQAKQPDSRASYASFCIAYCCNLQPLYTTQRLILLQQRRTQIIAKSPVQNYIDESNPFHYLDLRDIRIETPIPA